MVMKNYLQTTIKFTSLTILALVVFSADSFAGTGGSEWDGLKTTILSWVTGTPAYIAGILWLVFGITKIPVGEFKQLIFSIIAIAAIALVDTVVGTTITALI